MLLTCWPGKGEPAFVCFPLFTCGVAFTQQDLSSETSQVSISLGFVQLLRLFKKSGNCDTICRSLDPQGQPKDTLALRQFLVFLCTVTSNF